MTGGDDIPHVTAQAGLASGDAAAGPDQDQDRKDTGDGLG
jgi:hypothetical protein